MKRMINEKCKMKSAKCKPQRQKHRGHRSLILTFTIFILQFAFAGGAFAVPETAAVRVTDVTTSSCSVVWLTDVAADPVVEVYADNSMLQPITEGLVITPMPAASAAVAEAARTKGIMKVRVTGLKPSTPYYVRTVTRDQVNPDSVSYSALQEVTTASEVVLYRTVNSTQQGVMNDLVAFSVYIRPSDTSAEPGRGDLILLESDAADYPLSAFVAEWGSGPEGIVDLNNLFDTQGLSLDTVGGERIVLRIYREGTLSTLIHYRRVPQDGKRVYVVEPQKGYFADVNLDGNVDDEDFVEFKQYYRTVPDDTIYNPDFDFVPAVGGVDVREFSKFSRDYGKTGIE